MYGSSYIPDRQNMKCLSPILSYPTTRSTNDRSILAISCLNCSTSFQQSSGRRSFKRRHRTTSARARSTFSSRSASFFLDSSFPRSRSISFSTVSRDGSTSVGVGCEYVGSGGAGVGETIGKEGASYSRPAKGIRGASRSRDPAGKAAVGEGFDGTLRLGNASATRRSISSRLCCSRCRRRSSSSATRAWMCSSNCFARAESVCRVKI